MHEIQWTEEKVKRIWDYYAKNPSYQNQYFSFHSGKFILKHVKRYLPLKKMDSILDFGCGTGYLMEHLLKLAGGQCFGLDLSEEAVRQVNQRFSSHPGFGKAVWVERLPSPFAGNSMDLVISVEVVEHLDDEQLSEMLKEIYRILKPEGYLVITTPNKEDLEANKAICPECGCIFHRWQHVKTWSSQDLESWLIRHNFKPELTQATFFQSSAMAIMNMIIRTVKILQGKRLLTYHPHLIAIAKKHV